MNRVWAALIIFNTAVKKYWLNVQIYYQFIISYVFLEIILPIMFFFWRDNEIVVNEISYSNETAQWRLTASAKSALA